MKQKKGLLTDLLQKTVKHNSAGKGGKNLRKDVTTTQKNKEQGGKEAPQPLPQEVGPLKYPSEKSPRGKKDCVLEKGAAEKGRGP